MIKPILRDNVEHNFWKYEIDVHRQIVKKLIAGGVAPQDAKQIYDESLKNVKRFVWYALGIPCPF